jgi:predicted nicotinamide N-methyase
VILARPKARSTEEAADFVRCQTKLASPPLLPDIRLHLATEITPLWQSTEDRLARTAIALNGAANHVALEIVADDLTERASRPWDLILAGDVCYERPMAERVMAWLGVCADEGIEVLLGDPERAYLPTAGLVKIARYEVPTPRELEDRDSRSTVIYRLVPRG